MRNVIFVSIIVAALLLAGCAQEQGSGNQADIQGAGNAADSQGTGTAQEQGAGNQADAQGSGTANEQGAGASTDSQGSGKIPGIWNQYPGGGSGTGETQEGSGATQGTAGNAELEIVELGCRYQYGSYFIILLKSVAAAPIPLSSNIVVRTDDGHYSSHLIQNKYANGAKVWTDKITRATMGSFGMPFYVEGINPRNGGHIEQNYAFIYCPPGVKPINCDRSSGTVIYDGNAMADCTLEGDGINYFVPVQDRVALPA
ncbi:MAG: hypothetical protein V1676_06275 [Candidatus Diapherotrites archaeon]